MRESYFARLAYAMADAVIADIEGTAASERAASAAEFILAVHQSMQPLYHFGLRVVAFVFDALVFFRCGLGFRRLVPAARMGVIDQWLKSRIGVKRDFVKFFLNLTLVSYYDSPEVLRGMGIDIKAHERIQAFHAGQ